MEKLKLIIFWIMLNKNMNTLLRNNKEQQFFCDTKYKCISPTFHRFKMFSISGYNL